MGRAEEVSSQASNVKVGCSIPSHRTRWIGEDARGELYFTDYGTGEAYKIVPN
jgi:hypothetical protein